MTRVASASLLPFGAIVQGDVRFNLKRAAPYVLMLLFGANAALWWGAGPAEAYGWATNSDMFIVHMFAGFTFMTLPFFTALLMGDPVIRDFEVGVDPLIFSKPVTRLQYLLGKFLGNFLVLVACQACFALTLLVLQAVRPSDMLVLAPRVLPYVRHFLVLMVVSSLPLAVVAFTVGTLTRSAKLAYATAGVSYVAYVAWQTTVLRGLPTTWRIVLDPLLMNWGDIPMRTHSAAWLNAHAFAYGADVVANRALVLLASALCFAVLYVRFSASVRNPAAVRLTTLRPAPGTRVAARGVRHAGGRSVRLATGGRAILTQTLALVGAELRLLTAERSLVVAAPLALATCLVEPAYLGRVADAGSALYAWTLATPLLVMLTVVVVLYVGEAMHRDRALRVEPLVWAAPVPDALLLAAKLTAALVVALALAGLAGLAVALLQVGHGHAPVALRPYALVLLVVVLPAVLFLLAAAAAVNVLLRDKHVAYAVALAIGGGLYFLYSYGHTHWLYNPLLYRLWSAADLDGASPVWRQVVVQRGYVLGVAIVLLAVARLAFARRASGRGRTLGDMRGALILCVVGAALAVALGTVVAR